MKDPNSPDLPEHRDSAYWERQIISMIHGETTPEETAEIEVCLAENKLLRDFTMSLRQPTLYWRLLQIHPQSC